MDEIKLYENKEIRSIWDEEKEEWYMYYAKTEWDNKWGSNKPQKLTLRFTAYFNNGWIETDDVEVIIDNRDSFWKLHRAW